LHQPKREKIRKNRVSKNEAEILDERRIIPLNIVMGNNLFSNF
jgi:hypothetical protein